MSAGELARTADLEATIVQARDEARHLGHRRAGSEHLLLALLGGSSKPAAAVIAALHLDTTALQAEIKEVMPLGARAIEGEIPLTDSANAALRRAEAVARRMNAPAIDTDHLLLGIASVPEGVASRVLLDFGASAEKIRRLVEQETTERQTHTCHACGTRLEPAWRFCPMCGEARVAV